MGGSEGRSFEICLFGDIFTDHRKYWLKFDLFSTLLDLTDQGMTHVGSTKYRACWETGVTAPLNNEQGKLR